MCSQNTSQLLLTQELWHFLSSDSGTWTLHTQDLHSVWNSPLNDLQTTNEIPPRCSKRSWHLLDCLLGRKSSPPMVDWQVLAVDAVAALHKSVGWFVVHWSQRPNVADELIQQGWLNQISLLRNQWLFWEHHFLGSHWIRGKKAPVDVATIPQVWVVRILRQSNASLTGWSELMPVITLFSQQGFCWTKKPQSTSSHSHQFQNDVTNFWLRWTS